MVRVFLNHVVPRGQRNWIAPRSLKPMTIPAVKVSQRRRPHRAVGSHQHRPHIRLGDPLLRAKSLKARAQKTVNAVLRGYPEKPAAVGRQVVDGKVLQPLGLPESAKYILLR